MSTTALIRLVDAHHHLWDLDAVDYPWLRALGVRRFFGDPTPIQRNYVVADLRHDASGIEIQQSVHIQVGCAPGQELAETRWLDAIAARDGLPTAIVAAVDLTRPDVEDVVLGQLASRRLRGVRQIVGREPTDDVRTGAGGVLEDAAFVRGLGVLAAHDLSFDLQLTVPQMERVAELLATVPDLRVALCHCGSPWDQSARGIALWSSGLARLAALPRVVCKISGLSMFDPAWRPASYTRLVRTVLDTFGPERCMFGSNFPVDGLHRSYAEIVAATRDATAPRGADAEDAVFLETARRFYRL